MVKKSKETYTVIREYKNICTSEELLRNIIRLHLSESKTGTLEAHKNYMPKTNSCLSPDEEHPLPP